MPITKATLIENLLTDFGFEYVTVSGRYIRYAFKGRNETYYMPNELNNLNDRDIRYMISGIINATCKMLMEDIYETD